MLIALAGNSATLLVASYSDSKSVEREERRKEAGG
jgi:hypothetical protein